MKLNWNFRQNVLGKCNPYCSLGFNYVALSFFNRDKDIQYVAILLDKIYL